MSAHEPVILGSVIDGETVKSGTVFVVKNKYTGDIVAQVHEAGADDVRAAIRAAWLRKERALLCHQRNDRRAARDLQSSLKLWRLGQVVSPGKCLKKIAKMLTISYSSRKR